VRNTKLNNMVATDYALPGNGVIYVTSIAGATCTQTPQSITYSGSGSDGDGCADVYISGTYAGSMTIGSAKDIIIRPTASPAAMAANPALQTDGDLKRADGSSWLLGLIANNYVRVYHPCTGGTNTSPVMNTVRIDAAILSLLHSFIADNWACGAQLDALTVNGAIAQKYRGTVGTSGGTGFKKDYNYDDRFKFRSPPFFLDPVAASWRILKAHEQMPAR
jgi:hypothetical protein